MKRTSLVCKWGQWLSVLHVLGDWSACNEVRKRHFPDLCTYTIPLHPLLFLADKPFEPAWGTHWIFKKGLGARNPLLSFNKSEYHREYSHHLLYGMQIELFHLWGLAAVTGDGLHHQGCPPFRLPVLWNCPSCTNVTRAIFSVYAQNRLSQMLCCLEIGTLQPERCDGGTLRGHCAVLCIRLCF